MAQTIRISIGPDGRPVTRGKGGGLQAAMRLFLGTAEGKSFSRRIRSSLRTDVRAALSTMSGVSSGSIRQMTELSRRMLGDSGFQHLAMMLRTSDVRIPAVEQLMVDIDWLRIALSRAREGDPDAIVRAVRLFGIGIFAVTEIREHVERLDPAEPADREVRQRLATELTHILVPPLVRGRPRLDGDERIKLVLVLQAAYDEAKPRLKPEYRNPAARKLAIREFSEHIASRVPSFSSEVVAQATEKVLLSGKRLPRGGFGYTVAAEVCSRSPRQIRSLRRRGQSRK